MSNDQSVNVIASFSRSNEVTKRLLELIDRFDYQLVQENGQRRLTSASLVPRTKGAEIFLGRLPRDCYEDELVPLLMRIGRVVELRLMMDFSGSTRGYAFASFEHPRIARKACDELNGYEIRAGHKIGVVKSIDNCRLFLGGVPKDKTKADFMKELGKMLDGITNIYVYPSTEDKTLNRGFVFVEFRDHRSAAMARRKLIPGRVMLWDHEVAVDWADPEPGQDIDDEVMETVSALFIRNLALTATEPEIRHAIQRMTGVQIMKIKKINHFAFLHYETRAQAQRVLDIMKQPRGSETSEWELTWAKPIRKSEKLQERLRCTKNNQGSRADGQEQNRKNQSNNNNIKKEKKGFSGRVPYDHKAPSKARDCNGSVSPNLVKSSSNYSTPSNAQTYININESKIVAFDSSKEMNYNAILSNDIKINENNGASHHFDEGYYDNRDRAGNHMLRNVTDDDLAECAKALGELAARRFHANLRYEYWNDGLRNEYFCKIILERNGCELMSYQGNPATTMHEAVRLTIPNAYDRLQSMLMHAIKYV